MTWSSTYSKLPNTTTQNSLTHLPILPSVFPPLCCSFSSLLSFLANGNQLSDNQILFIEPFLPALQILQFLRVQALQIIQRPFEIRREHILVEALARETASRVAAGEVFIWAALIQFISISSLKGGLEGNRTVSGGETYRTVEVATWRDIEDFSPHSEIDGSSVGAVEWEQRLWGEGLEDDGCWSRGYGDGRSRTEAEVEGEEKEGEEEEVDGSCDGCAATWMLVMVLSGGGIGRREMIDVHFCRLDCCFA